MILCIALNPSIDKLVLVDRVRPGTIHRPDSVVAVPGGKGLNAARAAASLGADVRVACLAGGYAGRWVVDSLVSEGIDVVFAPCSGETRSSLSVFSEDGAHLTEFYEPGAPVEPGEWEVFVALIDKAVNEAAGKHIAEAAVKKAAPATWVTISGSVPPNVDAASVGELVDLAHTAGAQVAIDLKGDVLTACLSRSPELVKVNLHEAVDAAGLALSDQAAADGWEDAVRAAHSLRGKAGEGNVTVVTNGSKGALMCARDGMWVARVPETGPFPVGCGDAFLGGMVTALDRARAWPDAFRFGVGAGAANALAAGAGRLEPARARRLADEVVPVPYAVR